jgi:hypothetical protein
LVWSGSAQSAVDLNPTDLGNVVQSNCLGTDGTQEVGFGNIATGTNPRTETVSTHAMLWNGTAGSAVDLNPTNLSGMTISYAYGTDGTQQVGCSDYGGLYYPGTALLWSGTASSAVDLNPTGLNGIGACLAYGVYGSQQVGFGQTPGQGDQYHALLWTGTAASAVDLNNPNVGTAYSEALATNGTQQVGDGFNYDATTTPQFEDGQALLWSGTAASVVQLQAFLPLTGAWTESTANSIDPAGNVYGTANGTFDGFTGTFAVEWSPVPEPATASMMLIAVGGLFMRGQRNTRA